MVERVGWLIMEDVRVAINKQKTSNLGTRSNHLCGSREQQNIFMFILNSMYHFDSKLFDPVDLTCHPIFVKNGPTVSLRFYGQSTPKNLQILFHAILNNPINNKIATERIT